jgi:energy-coupling factor transporter ATP-binding protein EcfA2
VWEDDSQIKDAVAHRRYDNGTLRIEVTIDVPMMKAYGSGSKLEMRMDVVVKNCNNIDEAKISISIGGLNVKYGPNGTGKTTLAQAMRLKSAAADLSPLLPFKYRKKQVPPECLPAVEGIDQFKAVAVFNDEYVNQFVFKQDEIVKNSFDIFIKNADYDHKMKEIEELVASIKKTFDEANYIDAVIVDMSELSESFGKSQSGYSKSGKIAKGFGKGNKIEHVPAKLAPYSTFIKSENNVKWIKWQIEGNQFLPLSTDCPYCTAPTAERKETILAVSKEYDAKAIEHLVALQQLIERLSKYFSPATLEAFGTIARNQAGLKSEEIQYLIEIKGQVDTLRQKLVDIKNISFFSLREVDKVQQSIAGLKVELHLFSHLNSDSTKEIIEKLNAALDAVLGKAGELQGQINTQKIGIQKAITKYKNEINNFLRYAGYRYEVDILPETQSYKMKLKHQDFHEYIEDSLQHLSYGEKNAFSIVLFMYECLTKNPDFVILDDPISSFDKAKKFAILEMLFRGKDSFQEKTVLMLTHDIEPVIDLIKNLAHTFHPVPVASFLKCAKGSISELVIGRDDIMSFAQICRENINTLHCDVIKLIYLRRHYEILDSKGPEYHVLSNLLHKRPVPLVGNGGPPMAVADVTKGTDGVKVEFASFDYAAMLAQLTDTGAMLAAYKAADNNYTKLQLFRIINGENHDNDVVKNYVNKTFHIENEYVMQLNPHKYDFVPEHIIAECDQFLKI